METFFFVANIIGGLGVFLYGLKLLSTSIRSLSSDKLKRFFDFLTRNKLMGLTFGAVITSLLQSSSATTVIMIGFANAGIISLAQGISIIFGANIGTTITAQIIAFKASKIALPLIGFGAILYFFSRKKSRVHVGEILIGLGLLFYGLKLMGSFLKPLKDSPVFADMMVSLGQYPLWGILAGLLVTVVVQSSSATTGLIITLGSMGLIDFQSAFCLELGSNIGTTVTAQLAAIGTNRTAKRAAWAHTLFNVIGSTYMLLLLYVKIDGQPIFLRLIDYVTPGNVFAGENLPRHFANAHTVFNITNAIVLFPFIDLLAKATMKIIPGEDQRFVHTSQLDSRMTQTPVVALEQAKKETKAMAIATRDMTKYMYQALYRHKVRVKPYIEECELHLNKQLRTIVQFLVELNPKLEDTDDQELSNALVHTVEYLERIGDHNTAIVMHYDLLAEHKSEYSDDVMAHFKKLHHEIQHFFYRIIDSFDQLGARSISIDEFEDLNENVFAQEESLQLILIQQLRKKKLTVQSGVQLMEILNHFERIRSHLFKIAKQFSRLD